MNSGVITLLLSLFLGISATAGTLESEVKNAKGPAEYLIQKFQEVDVILLGEDHAVLQN